MSRRKVVHHNAHEEQYGHDARHRSSSRGPSDDSHSDNNMSFGTSRSGSDSDRDARMAAHKTGHDSSSSRDLVVREISRDHSDRDESLSEGSGIGFDLCGI